MNARILVAAAAVAALFAIPAAAIEKYTGDVTAQCVKHQGSTYNVVAKVTAPNWTVDGLQYKFDPGPVLGAVNVDKKTRYFVVKPGSHTVNLGNPEAQGTYTVVATDCGGFIGDLVPGDPRVIDTRNPPYAEGLVPRNGMTWSVLGTNPVNGTIRAGCKVGCDPHKGDTPCATPLPLLCVKKSGAGFPLPPPAGFNNSDAYNKWVGGIIATTAPAAAPSTLTAANAACATAFGSDWRVAEFHDGEGWAFWAYGGVGNPSGRFRVHINDQPANCWQ